ncbi:MAG: YggW family oxidoreductase [Gallionellales bacterium 35-53-114]|jgi:oxygen-independent coproporphyrinogen-3 oxidase|nr:MAG: YggW family oxidoreductase [Gallionellales bacterium 35-53-114]OYZ63796.1 MAG: YggW family oxidoreductase [Gallionellales bacterium 24-53-125]OZB09371.1 MAG: YggW family oxidoreductase [Gallionellales bacterium 39-52-133]HQS57972.1 radical SAM family heme chaperone HemW [Gallionellaceae bacterium]HQS76133.1 radical SAM family heme chaperone HemW [Gallionellaceae bacterium]
MKTQVLHPTGLKSQAVSFKALPPLSLYIHIPWCVRKCPYCDFNSHEARGDVPEAAYVAALIRDLEMSLPLVWGRKVYSVFIGGGTPSLLSAQAIDKILGSVRMLLPLDVNAEITLEANPGTVEAEKFKGFREAGVNRLSLGIQSFNEVHLKALGRIHNSAEARRAVEIAQNHFDNINLDLMYALPQQTLAEAEQDVRTALEFSPQHLSCYHLTLEPNTLFHRYPPSLPDDDASSEMQQRIEALLAEHGYLHYETSAFALPKKQSRHNLNYWQFGDYLGIGAGAHSKISSHDSVLRQARYKQPQAYLDQVAQGNPVQTENKLTRDDLSFEFMMNALRLNEGFSAELFQERTTLPLMLIRKELEQAEKGGLLVRDSRRIVPTELGRRFLNDLLEIFLKESM